MPRFFWGAFIVSLYAVLEASIIEIARLLQKAQNQGIAITDLRGDFLERANKYYKHVLNFELCSDDKTWQRIKHLASVRHSIAHANGRIDVLNDNNRKAIKTLEKQNVGISSYNGYVLLDSSFVKETFSKVRSMLENLVERHKEWDTKQKTV